MFHIRVTTVFGNKANTASLEQVRMIRQLGNSNESTNTHCDKKKKTSCSKVCDGFFAFFSFFFKVFSKRKTKHSAGLLQVLKQMPTPLLTVHVALSKHCNTFPNRMVT